MGGRGKGGQGGRGAGEQELDKERGREQGGGRERWGQGRGRAREKGTARRFCLRTVRCSVGHALVLRVCFPRAERRHFAVLTVLCSVEQSTVTCGAYGALLGLLGGAKHRKHRSKAP